MWQMMMLAVISVAPLGDTQCANHQCGRNSFSGKNYARQPII
jgi:hypothetical protein